MEKHLELTDAEFEWQFEQCKLDPAIFSHEAHLRLAWIHIRQYGIESALQNIQSQLQNFVVAAGAEDKYNTTLTVAAVKAVYHFVLQSRAQTFKAFLAEFPRLKTHFKDLMGFHYGIDIFNSQEAKVRYLEPDLLPFD